MLSERRLGASPPRELTAGGRYRPREAAFGVPSPLTIVVMNTTADSSRHIIKVKLDPFGCVTLCCVWLPITHCVCMSVWVSQCLSVVPHCQRSLVVKPPAYEFINNNVLRRCIVSWSFLYLMQIVMLTHPGICCENWCFVCQVFKLLIGVQFLSVFFWIYFSLK